MMRILLILLPVLLFAQPTPKPVVPTVFSGHGAPGSYPTSKLGDKYVDVDGPDNYSCMATFGGCRSVSASGWVGTFPATAHLIKGDGVGNGADSGIVAANVPLLNGANVFTGIQTYSAASLTNVEYDNGTCITAMVIAPANGNIQKVTLTNAQICALTFTQPSGSTATIQLKIIQSAVSTFNGRISGGKWPGGVVPTITATSGAVDLISCYLDGTNAYCKATQDLR